MAEQNYTIELDLNELVTMVENLVPYIYEDELYGGITLRNARLTPGSILLRLRRLQALRNQLTEAQRAQLTTAENGYANVHKEWNVAFNKKLVRESESRLRDIQTFLSECKDDPKLCANAYMPEALRRTIIAEIMDTLPTSDGHYETIKNEIRRVDGGLRRNVQEGEFIWAETLRPIYPREQYWWLYGRPAQPD
ncbi:MAG: hypothetical protein R3E39_04400 [Anaerolineae bacterium]